MVANRKNEIISFKVDNALAALLQNLPNRSEFIRSAILHALDATCPLCQGTGVLSHNQLKHWHTLAQSHALNRCEICHEIVLTCSGVSETKINSSSKSGEVISDDQS